MILTSQPYPGQANDGHVLDGGVGGEKVLDLHGVEVLAAHHDDVFLAVDQPVEAVLVLARHVAGVQPAVDEGLGRGRGVLVVALHEAGALDAELADLAGRDLGAILAHDPAAPAVTGHADRAHVVDVLQAEVHAARTDGFAQTVVRVVLVIREILLPTVNQTLRNRLCADVHQPPLRKLVVLQMDSAIVQCLQNVQCPRHQQPDNGAVSLS